MKSTLLFWVVVSCSILSACGFSRQKAGTTPTVSATSPKVTSTVLNASVQTQALQVLSTHCESCHGTENFGGLDSILDPNHLVAAGIIIPGDPTDSILIQYTTSGRMPLSGPLDASDIATLTTWVQGTEVVAIPSPSPSGSVSLAQEATAIFTNNCVSCHGNAGSGGLSNSADSPIYSRISAGTMPPTGSLAPGDIQTIASWIDAGAPAE
jgi:mono/diheme cytochrome c family protein